MFLRGEHPGSRDEGQIGAAFGRAQRAVIRLLQASGSPKQAIRQPARASDIRRQVAGRPVESLKRDRVGCDRTRGGLDRHCGEFDRLEGRYAGGYE